MLAYSSIAHAGYLLAAFTALSQDGIAAASFYTVSYAIMNVGIFAVFSHAGGYTDRLSLVQDYRGLAYRSPLLGGALAFFLISLIGIPFTGGFFGKFYSFTAAMYTGHVWLAVIGLINSGIACFYYLRLLAALYTRPVVAPDSNAETRKVAVPAGIALACAALATLILGIAPGRLLHLTQRSTPITLPVASAPPSEATPAQTVPGQ